MKRKSNPRTRATRTATKALSCEISSLLEEIEKEPVPDRLLALALQLQGALARQRGEEAEAQDMPQRAKAGRS